MELEQEVDVDSFFAEMFDADALTKIAESPKETRKMRNRRSAAASRLRKKQYLQHLEERIASLQAQACALEEENRRLRSHIDENKKT